jgi:hypothetical protein
LNVLACELSCQLHRRPPIDASLSAGVRPDRKGNVGRSLPSFETI